MLKADGVKLGMKATARWALTIAIIVVALAGAFVAGRALWSLRPLPPAPVPSGRILQEATSDFARLSVGKSDCVFVNNTWNKAVSDNRLRQSVFVEQVRDRTIGGWRWRTPWQVFPKVNSQPHLVCGDSPWGEPRRLRSDFPFRVDAKRLTATFSVRLEASGTYNLALSMWAVSRLPAERESITHEIMIWIGGNGPLPAGYPRARVSINGSDFYLWIKRHHRDISGVTNRKWTYVAFIAEKPILKGTLDISALIDALVARKILDRASYITSVELGSEVCEGIGLAEIRQFDLAVMPR